MAGEKPVKTSAVDAAKAENLVILVIGDTPIKRRLFIQKPAVESNIVGPACHQAEPSLLV